MNDVNALGEQLRVRIDWSAVETARPLHTNQVLAQVGNVGNDGQPDGIYLTFGAAPAPAVMANQDPEGTSRLIDKLKTAGIQVNILGQFHFTRQMLSDLISLLHDTAAKYDQAVAAGESGADGGKE